MTETLKFELVSPERLLVSADVEAVVVPGAEGDFMVLPKHAPFISTLRPGVLRVPNLDGREAQFYVRGGFAEAGPDALTVLAETAMPIGDLTAASLEAQLREARDEFDAAKDDETRLMAADTLERLVSLKDALRIGV
jgi:F-type H+-transporting ATPase subunit epsilon